MLGSLNSTHTEISLRENHFFLRNSSGKLRIPSESQGADCSYGELLRLRVKPLRSMQREREIFLPLLEQLIGILVVLGIDKPEEQIDKTLAFLGESLPSQLFTTPSTYFASEVSESTELKSPSSTTHENGSCCSTLKRVLLTIR